MTQGTSGLLAKPGGPKFEANQKAIEAYNSFVENEVPAHMQKWGEWFYFNIQSAFEKRYGRESSHGPKSPTAPPQHPAQRETKWDPNS